MSDIFIDETRRQGIEYSGEMGPYRIIERKRGLEYLIAIDGTRV
jgi:hypothetical protein